MSDDWMPVKQAAADDDWAPVAQQAAPPEPATVPPAFLDRVRAGQVVSRVFNAAAKEAGEGAGGQTPTGFSDETLGHLIDLGVFHDPERGRPGPIQFGNEAILMPAAQAWQAITSGISAGIHGAGGAVGQIVEEFGGSEGQGNRAKNEVINAGNWAMIEGGMGRFSRPSIEGGAVADRAVGGLPRPEDFSNAGKVLDSPHAEANLHRMWEEDGIHPAEAVHDAQGDAFIKNEITAPPMITVFHGSPHEFERFDISKLGTGEGNQTYGHGLYFAENESTARSYRDMSDATIGGEKYNPYKAVHIATAQVEESGSRAAAIADTKARLSGDPDPEGFLAQVLHILERAQPLPEFKSSGNIYQARISAEPEKFINYGKPLDEQPAAARPILKRIMESKTGLERQYYIHKTTASEAAELAEAGVPGIRYFDAGSRAAEDGTRNYVVFDHNAVEITHKNGVPIEVIPESWMNAEDLQALTETGGKPGSLGAAATDPADVPLDVQPASPPGRLAAAFKDAGDTLLSIGRDAQMLTAPMATGTRESMAMAKDFANSLRRNRWDWSRMDKDIADRFTPEQRTRMWNAADEESTSIQLGEPASMREHQGLATLDPVERAAVEQLQTRAQNAWVRARDVGMVEGEGLPAYTPRMVINTAGAGSKEAALALDGIGSNLKTKTANMLKRKYLEASDTEAAAKAKYGDEAMLARDIRVLPLATSQLEDAIAGRSLINNIKDYGKQTGADTVIEGAIPAGSDVKWFTLDHPAFRTWRPKLAEIEGKVQAVKDEAGNPLFEQVPLYVHGDFEGPLRAVLSQKSGPLYGAMMSLKGKTMSLIMNSPMIHNAVEWGRALPAMPGKVATFKVYFEGNRAKNNVPLMHEAIDSGLVPIGHRFFNQDITSVMESPNMTPGRSWTSQVLAAVPGLFDEAAGVAVKRAVDKAGDFWHNTLLWDRIADLQMGLYTNLRADAMAKGIDQQTASRMAAHFANRYAGALPKEAMSDAATKVSNMLMFSRSFTMGNLGVIKDMFTGLPKDVIAQIERDAGFRPGGIEAADVEGAAKAEDAVAYAKSMARRKAISVVAMDMALMYIGNSLLQNVFNVLVNDSTLDKELHSYATRFQAKMKAVGEHPLELIQPLRLLSDLSSTSENEPGKGEKVHVGNAANGTAIYMRNPAGKIGEEFIGYMTGPLDMMRRKLGTIARPAWQVMNNDAGFGRKIYDPDADTPAKYLGNIGRIVKHMVGSQLPEGQIGAFSDLVKGEGDAKVNALQALGPFGGVTFSKGAPGGPAVGEMYANKTAFEFRVNQAMPDIRRQIQRGDIPGASQRMQELGMDASYSRWVVKTTLNPATRLGSKAMRDFYRTATPEQRARMERFQTAPAAP